MRVYFLTVFVLISLTGAGYYVLANDGVTLGEPVCGNPKYRTFKFKSGTEFKIPEAYLADRFGLDFWMDKGEEFANLIVVEMHRDDGRPNCEKVRDSKKGFVGVTIKPHRFEINKKTTKQWYPFHIEGEEELFELYRSELTRDPKKTTRKKDFLLPKSDDWGEKLFVECAISNFSYNPGERIGCRITSKLVDHAITSYGYYHTYLSDYQKIDTTLKQTILNFITAPPKGE